MYLIKLVIIILYLTNYSRSRLLDQRDIDQFLTREEFGIRSSYHSSDIQTRYQATIQRRGIFRPRHGPPIGRRSQPTARPWAAHLG
jgi:hypothetical protein